MNQDSVINVLDIIKTVKLHDGDIKSIIHILPSYNHNNISEILSTEYAGILAKNTKENYEMEVFLKLDSLLKFILGLNSIKRNLSKIDLFF